MHELSVMTDLIAKAAAVVADAGAQRASRVAVRIGALSHLSADHLESHFQRAAAGTVLDGAVLDIAVGEDPTDPHAGDVVLTSVDVTWEA